MKHSNPPPAGPPTVPVTLRVPREAWAHLEAIRKELGNPSNQATGTARILGRNETYLWLIKLGVAFLSNLAQDSSARIPGPVEDPNE